MPLANALSATNILWQRYSPYFSPCLKAPKRFINDLDLLSWKKVSFACVVWKVKLPYQQDRSQINLRCLCWMLSFCSYMIKEDETFLEYICMLVMEKFPSSLSKQKFLVSLYVTRSITGEIFSTKPYLPHLLDCTTFSVFQSVFS